jgi:hypothetical protein
MKTKRVQYNFVLKYPKGNPFTIQQLMLANPGVQYITLYMRLKKLIKGDKPPVQEFGTQQLDFHKRGRSQKLYFVVPKP